MKFPIKPTTMSQGDFNAQKTIKWRSKSGNEKFIEEMDDSHLLNSYKLLQRSDMNHAKWIHVAEVMKCEMERRKYAPDSEIEVMFRNKKIKAAQAATVSEAMIHTPFDLHGDMAQQFNDTHPENEDFDMNDEEDHFGNR